MPPKRKLTGPRTSRRFATYRNLSVTRLRNAVRLAPCPLCGSPKMLHHLCPTCGGYKRAKSAAPAAAASKQSKKGAAK